MRITLVMTLGLLLGCGDDSTGPSDAGTDIGDAGLDVSTDARGDTTVDPDSAFDAGPPPAGNTCETVIDVNSEGVVDDEGVLRLRGTNTAARQDLETCDRGVGIKLRDVVYQYTPPADGELRWTLDWVGDPALYWVDVRRSRVERRLRRVCDRVCASRDRGRGSAAVLRRHRDPHRGTRKLGHVRPRVRSPAIRAGWRRVQ